MAAGDLAMHAQAEPADRRQPTHVGRLVRLLQAHKRTLALLLLLSLLIHLCGLATPRCTQALLDGVIARRDWHSLLQLGGLLALLATFQIGLSLWRRLRFVALSMDLDSALLGYFCRRLLALPSAFFKRRQTGDLVGRLQDHATVRQLVVVTGSRVIIDVLMIGVYVGVLFAYSASLAFVLLTVVMAFCSFALLIAPFLKRQHLLRLQAKTAHESQLIEILGGIEAVKAMGLEEAAAKRWTGLFVAYATCNYRTERLRQLVESAGSAFHLLATLGVLGYGAVLVMRGALTAGELVAFSLYAALAVQPVLSLLNLWDEAQQARAVASRIQAILQEAPEQAEPQPRIAPLRGHVRFENVCFAYPGVDQKLVLKHVSLELHPEERVALVGRSGSGKTTLVRLLLGLYRPTAGRILIDGQDLASIDLGGFRRQVGAVLQESFLFAGTLSENITLGTGEVHDDRLRAALEAAGLTSAMFATTEALDAPVGERALDLSAGERQRLNLTRAFYREPRLLILDEATNNLDALTDSAIQNYLFRGQCTSTVLLIAHKLASVQNADRILVLEHGQIVESGGHTELIARGGAYSRLATEQRLR